VSARPVVVLADALALVRACLRDSSELAGVRVVLTSPKDVSTPWLRITRVGGADYAPHVPIAEVATIDVAAFVPPTTQSASALAHDLARRAAAVLRAALGYEHEGGAIARVEIPTAIAWSPDESRTPPTPRFVFSAYVFVTTRQTQEVA
jgi:hypothetical protein